MDIPNKTTINGEAESEFRLCFMLQEHIVFTLSGAGEEAVERQAEYGELLLIPPQASFKLLNRSRRDAQAVLIRFQCDAEWLPEAGMSGIVCCRMPQAKSWTDALLNPGGTEMFRHLQSQSYLYAMCAALTQAGGSPGQESTGMEQYVEQTLQYMNSHYHEQLDIEELARNSGAGASRFYQLFKIRTGLSPLKYMTRLRMDAALEVLGGTRSSVLEVAHSIGYEDEFYFSRLFKKQMGVTPTEYAQRAHKRVACLSPVFEGDLTALGVAPVLSLAKGWSKQPEAALRRIRESRPELILTSPVAPDIQDFVYRGLNEIAPTIVLYWKKYSWRERFVEIAGHLNLTSVAERWLAYYSQRVTNASSQLRSRLGDLPHLVVVATGSQFRVFDSQPTVNELFYEDLRVMPPEQFQRTALLSMSSLEEVAELGCGNIVLLVDEACPDDYCMRLEQSWRALAGRYHDSGCFIVRMARPQAYHAQGRDELIDYTVQHLLHAARHVGHA